MALIYTYKDSFMVDSIDPADLEAEEVLAIARVDVLAVITEPFREQMVTASVYAQLAVQQLEAEGMLDKKNAYEKIFKDAYSLAKTSSPTSVSNIPIGRG